jgi:large subunit ribosomal protein L31e
MEEKLYTIPLSRAKTAPKVRRSAGAIKVIKDYLSRNLNIDMDSLHMDPSINEAIWSRGNKKIPSKVRVRVVQLEEGIIEASLPGVKTRSEIERELEKKAKKQKEQEKEEREKKAAEKEKKKSSEAKEEGEKKEEKTVEAAQSNEKDTKKLPKSRPMRTETGDTHKKNATKNDASSQKKSSENISKKEKEG